MFWSFYYNTIVLSVFLISLSISKALGKKVAEIYWNSSNPIFSGQNDSNIFSARIRDSVDFICPKYETNSSKEIIEHSMIQMVSEEDYGRCSTEMNANIVGLCKFPFKEQFITVVFREFTPNPNGLEFRPNNKYYFITSSTGTDSGLYNLVGGLCKEKNMKVIIEIKSRQYEINSTSPNPSKRKCEEQNEFTVANSMVRDKINYRKNYFNHDRKDDVPKTIENVTKTSLHITSSEIKTKSSISYNYSSVTVTVFDRKIVQRIHNAAFRQVGEYIILTNLLLNFVTIFILLRTDLLFIIYV